MTFRILLAGAAALAFATPALADHAGPSGLGQGGGALDVIGADTLDAGHFAVGLRIGVAVPDDRSDAELEALAAQHVHAHNTDYNLNAGIGVAYGISHHLTVSAELPYIRRDDLREGTHAHDGGAVSESVERLGNVSGIGDASLIAKYRLTEEHGPGFAIIAGLKMPTGSTHRVSPDGERLETEHQPGTGSWDPILGAAVGAAAGAVRLNASALYQFSGKGAQDTRLGDRFKGGIALSHHFGAAEHHHDSEAVDDHHGDHEHEAAPHSHASWDAFVETTAEWEGRQRIVGEVERESGGTIVWLSPGARYNFASGFSAAASFSVPVWQHVRESHPDNDYRLTFAVGRAF
jgi:hypothetical protein